MDAIQHHPRANPTSGVWDPGSDVKTMIEGKLLRGSMRKNMQDLNNGVKSIEVVLGLSRNDLGGLYECAYHWQGDHSDDYYDMCRHARFQFLRTVMTWSTITRGRDLFIPTLGGFDINKVYAQVLTHVKVTLDYDFPDDDELDVDRRPYVLRCGCTTFRRVYLVSPRAVQCHAYFGDALACISYDYDAEIGNRGHYDDVLYVRTYVGRILDLPEDSPSRMHLIRHHKWWNHKDNSNALDELHDSFSHFDWRHSSDSLLALPRIGQIRSDQLTGAGIPDIPTLAALVDDHTLREAFNDRLVMHSSWDVDGRNLLAFAYQAKRVSHLLDRRLRPPELLNRLRDLGRLERHGATRTFSHLNSQKDGPVEPDGTRLQILRDSWRVEEVAGRLHNCAGSYIQRCESEKYILVALVDAEGAPLALGGYQVVDDRINLFHINVPLGSEVDTDDVDTEYDVDQVVGNCNEDPDDVTKARFRDFLLTVNEWSQA